MQDQNTTMRPDGSDESSTGRPMGRQEAAKAALTAAIEATVLQNPPGAGYDAAQCAYNVMQALAQEDADHWAAIREHHRSPERQRAGLVGTESCSRNTSQSVTERPSFSYHGRADCIPALTAVMLRTPSRRNHSSKALSPCLA